MYGQDNALRQIDVSPVRQAEIPAEVEQIQALAKSLHEGIGILEDRLSPVLSTRKGEAGACETSAPEPVRVPLAQRLHEITVDYAAIESRIRSIVNRLEL